VGRRVTKRINKFQDVRMRVWRLKTKDRITDVDSRWSIEARYMPRDSVVDVGAQMKEVKETEGERILQVQISKAFRKGERRTREHQTELRLINIGPRTSSWGTVVGNRSSMWSSSGFHMHLGTAECTTV
jgi:carbamoylphosphate synthase large subunit